MRNIQKSISDNLKDLRRTRGMSLDQTAELTGVSKAMLGQIERGESNPTVTTLWKIASGLQISFSSLIDDTKANVLFVEKEQICPVMEAGQKYRVYSIFPFDPRRKFEIYTVELEHGYTHHSEKHNEGVEEYITVTSGVLEVTIEKDNYRVKAGDSIRFSANQEHSYRSLDERETVFQLVMYYP